MAELDVVDEFLADKSGLNAQAVSGTAAPEEKAVGTAIVAETVAEVADLLAERVVGWVHCSGEDEDRRRVVEQLCRMRWFTSALIPVQCALELQPVTPDVAPLDNATHAASRDYVAILKPFGIFDCLRRES